MIDKINTIVNLLKSKNLKVTPQRITILEVIYKLNNHPTTEQIINEVRKQTYAIATGTIYKILDVLTENGLLNKVTTDKGVVRYDPKMYNHHHIYYSNSDIIDDYEDKELDKLIQDYFKKKSIKDMKIENFVLQIHAIPNEK